ncbi:hypothetical protein BZA77DRAFT_353949 [Pyronema omphalodes]|nr:hypothetical protein BZA77DRAFT_353949 [Pyronema omphalodes]
MYRRLDINPRTLQHASCAPPPAIDLGAQSVDVCVSCRMDRDRIPKPILAARYRNLLEHSCLDLNDRLQTVPLCECGHFSTGTEHWFNPPLNAHSQPVRPVSLQSDIVDSHRERQLPHNQSPRRVVTWALRKVVGTFHTKRPVTEDRRPSGGEAVRNGERKVQHPARRWWSLSRLVNVVKRPLYTTTWEVIPDHDIADSQ